MRPLLLASALALLPAVARPAPAGPACHCFNDRTYDAARPSAADPYILATTRSSLLSAAYGVPKAELVRAVMMGAAAEDLWIARWAGARMGADPAALLEAKGASGSWRAALAAGGARLGRPFADRLARGAPEAELAALAVDDVLVSRAGADAKALAALRAAGAGSEEAILATVLAPKLRVPPGALLAPVRAGKATWGSTVQSAGLTPRDLDRLVRQAVH
ncbi:hypothetical protein [Anaeromyxobacter paludicola]|uniref:Uncharacterized protein n=1 Tax=Anaeromyxobacter paludicola TaxID=2918171 RepID=A0ABM7XG65_9BACT|nr:hypothetical protein [Anaeromyxobacter paludicola]BDG10881.1 hypothetical protein AMPC_39940 [Anaeromyxobacter paludicola]